MSDTVDMFRDMKEHRKAVRRTYGVSCPLCPVRRPKASPTILIPGQQCRVDGYRDPRPELTSEQMEAAA